MWRYATLTSNSDVRKPIALVAALLCSALWIPPGVAANGTDELVRGGDADLVLWPQYEEAAAVTPLVDPSGEYVAVREPGNRLRIWQLADAAHLSGPTFDTDQSDLYARATTWCGGRLVFVSCPSPEVMHRIDREAPGGGIGRYLAEHTQVLLVDPKTGQRDIIARSGYMEALGSRDGMVLALFEPYAHWSELGGETSWLDATRVSDGAIIAHVLLQTGGLMRGGHLPRPLGWHPSGSGLFLLAETEAAILPGHPWPTRIPIVTFASLDGAQRALSNATDVRILPDTRGLTMVRDGEMVAAFLQPWGHHKSGVVLLGTHGIVKRYDFSVRSEFPPALRDIAPRWEPLSCTPDGQCALFQEVPSEAGQDLRVCIWDLPARQPRLLLRMPYAVRACHGWLGNDRMIVEVKRQARGESPVRGRSYGVLALPPL